MLSTDDKTTLRNLIHALRPFRELSDRITLATVLSFLHVAVNEEKSMAEYASALGFRASAASKHFADLGEINRWQERATS